MFARHPNHNAQVSSLKADRRSCLALFSVVSLLLLVTNQYAKSHILDICAAKIHFPRQGIQQCEGYYRHEASSSGSNNKLPFPVPHEATFCGQDEWVERAIAIQEYAMKTQGAADIEIHSLRGLSQSRIDHTLLGNLEFVDTESCSVQNDTGDCTPVCWTGDFVSHYVAGYNVVPSKEFFRYVVKKYAELEKAGEL
jgi:hypothetical protein